MENANEFDHRAESWCTHEPLASEDWLFEWTAQGMDDDLLFVTDYQVIDEEGKLNIMFASSAALEKLGMPAEQIACLFDWMDADGIARVDVTVYQGDSQVYAVQAAVGGEVWNAMWFHPAGNPPQDGPYRLVITATDRAGVQSTLTRDITVDLRP
jgi:hypothetical protein